jgi:hypothetical protein|nr:MAG TPA: hypothetical protein [Crassvirales sp.]
MIDMGILITGAIGLLTTLISGWTSWFFARKKYNSEVDGNLIANMKESLEFYKQLSDDNKKRLDEALKRSDYLEEEVKELRKQVLNLMTVMCTDLSCQLRKGDYKTILENGTSIKENI